MFRRVYKTNQPRDSLDQQSSTKLNHCGHGIYDAKIPTHINHKQTIKINCLSNGFMTSAEFIFTVKMHGSQFSFTGLADNPYLGANKIGLAKGRLDYQHMKLLRGEISPQRISLGLEGGVNYFIAFSYVKGDRTNGEVLITQEEQNLQKQSAKGQFRIKVINQTEKEWVIVGSHCGHGIYDVKVPSYIHPSKQIKLNCLSDGFMTGAQFIFTLKIHGQQLQFTVLADNPYIGTNKIGLALGKLDYQSMKQHRCELCPKILQLDIIGGIKYCAIFTYVKGDKTQGQVRIIQEAMK